MTAEDGVKTVFLVRHAQSEQNVATAKLAAGKAGALADIVALGYDAPLSKEGERQLQAAAASLKGFSAQHGIELVAHSPYQRAARTAKALFSDRPMVELPPLHERTVSEYVWCTTRVEPDQASRLGC